MKQRYIRIMEQVVDAYSAEHIDRYIESVKECGLKEHGFPRLCANIGILMAHGRKNQPSLPFHYHDGSMLRANAGLRQRSRDQRE